MTVTNFKNKPKLLFLIGESGSGKDELCKYVSKHKMFKKLFKPTLVKRLSGGDMVKAIAKHEFGWQGEKNPADRRLFKYITQNGRYKYQREFREQYNFYDILNIDKSIEDRLEVNTSFYGKALIEQAINDKEHSMFIYTDVRFIDEFRMSIDFVENIDEFFDVYYVLITTEESGNVITDEEIYELMNRCNMWHGEHTFKIHNDKTKSFYTQIDTMLNFIQNENNLTVTKLTNNKTDEIITINELSFKFFDNLKSFKKLNDIDKFKVYLIYNYIVGMDIYLKDYSPDIPILNKNNLNKITKDMSLYMNLVEDCNKY